MERNLICIICPRGCALTAEQQGDSYVIRGNACPRGEKYAIDECTHPVRTITSTARIINRADTMVSVKTETPIPKEKIFEVMQVIRGLQIAAPIAAGTVLAESCGSKIITTQTVE